MNHYFVVGCIFIALALGALLIRKANQILDNAKEILEKAEKGELTDDNGFNSEEAIASMIANYPYIPKNVIAVVTRNLPNADENLSAAIKDLIEKHPKHVSGLDTSFYMGNDSIVFRPSTPSIGWTECPGKAVLRVLAKWLEKQMEGTNPRGIDVMFFEPDVTHRVVVDAWHCKGMAFNEVHGYEGRREVNPLGRKTPDIFVKFTPAKTERDDTTTEQAQLLLDQFNALGTNPHTTPPVESLKTTIRV